MVMVIASAMFNREGKELGRGNDLSRVNQLSGGRV